jgi:hypothetical protein
MIGCQVYIGNKTRRKYITNYECEDEAEFDTFKFIFLEAYKITKRLNLTHADVNNENWNTSVRKLIGDAIIGFFKKFGI